MNTRKPTRLQKMKLEIAVKDKLISRLIHIVAENKIELPTAVLLVIEKLYGKKEKDCNG
jgi:hypothetical protein